MKFIKISLLIGSILLVLFGCEKDEETNPGFTTDQVVEGLKEALKVGTDSATKRLSATDGYLKDKAVKLLLPSEVQNSLTSFKSKSINVFGIGNLTGEDIYKTGIPGFVNPLSAKEDDLILGINRAAEAAAKDAGPIFIDAIINISIEDGSTILFGGIDSAATQYLSLKTRPQLLTKFEPKIEQSLSSVKVGNTSVVKLYEGYVTDYNDILNTQVPTGLLTKKSVAELMGINAVGTTDLVNYSTNKGLDGLFTKIKDEERNIRRDPLHRVTDILKIIFGALP